VIVNINAIVCNNDIADVNGSRWYVTEMEGWESPTIRSQTQDKTSRHGVLTTEGLYGPREIIVKGVCQANSPAGFYASWYYLAAQTNFLKRTTFVFSVDEATLTSINVIRAGELIMTNKGVNAFVFELPMRANDPFKPGSVV
jgi:hypothetical protein